MINDLGMEKRPRRFSLPEPIFLDILFKITVKIVFRKRII